MYVVLGVIFLVMIGAVGALSQIITSPDQTQREPFDRAKRRAELREEMHRRMRDKILHGIGPDQDLFKDMESDFQDVAGGDPFRAVQSNFKSDWKESSTGRILVLTPQSKDQKLNIDVNATMITIKGESQQKSANSVISSSFSNSFPVPQDCDGTKVKMSEKDGNLLVELPFKAAKTVVAPAKEERKPLPRHAGDIEI